MIPHTLCVKCLTTYRKQLFTKKFFSENISYREYIFSHKKDHFPYFPHTYTIYGTFSSSYLSPRQSRWNRSTHGLPRLNTRKCGVFFNMSCSHSAHIWSLYGLRMSFFDIITLPPSNDSHNNLMTFLALVQNPKSINSSSNENCQRQSDVDHAKSFL